MADLATSAESSGRSGGYAKGRETRRRVVEAAVEVFGKQGYAGASIEQIARSAGMTKGALYAHFRTKRDLYRAALGQGLGFIRNPPAPDTGRSAAEELAVYMRWLGHRLAEDAVARAFFLQIIHEGFRDDEDDRLVRDLMAPAFERLSSLISVVNPQADAGAFAFFIFSTLLLDRELHRFHVLMVGPEAEVHDIDTAVDQLVAVLAGLT